MYDKRKVEEFLAKAKESELQAAKAPEGPVRERGSGLRLDTGTSPAPTGTRANPASWACARR
jgi:hypothetical protein